jgi:hypothetical protein
MIVDDYQNYDINWQLIDDVIDFVKIDLLNYCLNDNSMKNRIVDKYDLAVYNGDHHFMKND